MTREHRSQVLKRRVQHENLFTRHDLLTAYQGRCSVLLEHANGSMESSAPGPHPSLSLALGNYKELKDFPYRPTAKPPSRKKMVGSHGSLPRLRRSGSRGSLGLSGASQCAAVIFRVIPVSCPQR